MMFKEPPWSLSVNGTDYLVSERNKMENIHWKLKFYHNQKRTFSFKFLFKSN